MSMIMMWIINTYLRSWTHVETPNGVKRFREALSLLIRVNSHLFCLCFLDFSLVFGVFFSSVEILESLPSSYRTDTPTQAPPPPPPSHSYVALMQTQAISDKLLCRDRWSLLSTVSKFRVINTTRSCCDLHAYTQCDRKGTLGEVCLKTQTSDVL